MYHHPGAGTGLLVLQNEDKRHHQVGTIYCICCSITLNLLPNPRYTTSALSGLTTLYSKWQWKKSGPSANEPKMMKNEAYEANEFTTSQLNFPHTQETKAEYVYEATEFTTTPTRQLNSPYLQRSGSEYEYI